MTVSATNSDPGQPLPRLLVLTSTYPRWPGDPEPGFVHELAKRLTGSFDVTVLGPHAPGAARTERMDDVQVRRYRYAPEAMETLVNDGGVVANLKRHPAKWLLLPAFCLSQLWSTWALIRTCKPDVIHAHWLVPQGLLALVAAAAGGSSTPVVVTSHGADLFALDSPLLRAVKRIVVRNASAVTVVSTAMLGELERIGTDSSRAVVAPMGVDLASRFSPDGNVRRSGTELLFVGRLVPKKGLASLIEALPQISTAHPRVTLTVVGFGPEEAALRAQVNLLGLGNRVSFAGAVGQAALPAYYRRAALFVAPFITDGDGNREGLGLVLLEAIGCGCPVVTTRVEAVKDVFGGSWPAQCAEPGSSSSLAETISTVLADQAASRLQAVESLARARGLFDWSVVAAKYSAILDDCARQIHSIRAGTEVRRSAERNKAGPR